MHRPEAMPKSKIACPKKGLSFESVAVHENPLRRLRTSPKKDSGTLGT